MNSNVSKPFLIVNASAGSGKTYNLVRNYLRLLLSENDDRAEISQIMAMTFTNKASIEMKSRIMSDLNKLANGKDDTDHYLNEIAAFVGTTPDAIRKRARIVLRKILHQYEDFNVMTIDKFNLRLIRSFARDLDLPDSFEISLDDTLILEKAIDELLSNIDAKNQTKLYQLALNFAKSNLEEENDWNLKKILLSKAKVLTNEGYFQIIRTLSKTDFKKEQLDLWKLQFRAEKDELTIRLNNLNRLFLETGIDENTFIGFGKSTTFNAITFNLRLNPDPILFLKESKRTDTHLKNIQKVIEAGKEAQFSPAYLEFLQYISEKSAPWIELDFKVQQFHLLAILKELALSMDDIRNKESIIRVSEFNKLVAELVQNEDAPFIYERLGSKFNHFFLDEFQDTSRLQWLNIVPLIHNSLGGNYFNFIVGDPKQSIYRFKNGVAEQFIALPAIYNPEEEPLIKQRSQFFQNMGAVQGLEDNWRSAEQIVNFNNRFFEELMSVMPESGKEFYAHLKQNPKGKKGGYVEILMNSQKDLDAVKFTNNQLLKWVQECIADGYKPHEICILGRKKRECNQYANFLKSRGYQIVSSDSLLVNSDQFVQLAISYCKWKVNRFDFQRAMQFAYFYFEILGKKDAFKRYGDCFWTDTDSRVYFSEQLFFEHSRLNADFLDASFQNIYSLLVDFLMLVNLDSIDNTYLQQLLDLAYQFDMSNGPDLMEFINYYEKNQSKFSVQLSENEQAIQIMTAHKSKGLEFPVVIIPSFNFFTKKNPNDSYLMEMNDHIIETRMSGHEKAIPAINQEAEKEDAAQKMDAINLLYVAFTRPQDRLYAINIKSHGNTFYPHFNSILANISPETEEQAGIFHLKFGEIPEIKHHSHKTASDYHPQSIQNFLWFPEISIQSTKEQEEDSLTTEQRIGKQFHFIMEKSHSRETAFSALKTGLLKGEIEKDFEEILVRLLNEAFENSLLLKLFDGGKHLNERTLIFDSKTRLRPDKLIVSDQQTIVIDFKTGEKSDKHVKQVQGYMTVLNQIGMVNIKGYLYYSGGWGLVEVPVANPTLF